MQLLNVKRRTDNLNTVGIMSPVTRLRVTWKDVQGLPSAWALRVISQVYGQLKNVFNFCLKYQNTLQFSRGSNPNTTINRYISDLDLSIH